MPTIRQSFAALAAGGNIANLIGGSVYEQMAAPTRVQVFASSDQGDVGIGVQLGPRAACIASETFIPLEPGAGQGPRNPDDQVIDDVALPGERIVIQIAGGAAISAGRVMVVLTEGA